MKQTLSGSQEILPFLSSLVSDRQTGELLLQAGEDSAKIYFHNGLIVWAFATGQRESFQSILLKENLLSKERLLEGIRESRRNGKKNLEDILSTLGVSDPNERRSIIERHTRSAIEVILSFKDCALQFNALSAHGDGGAFGLKLDALLPGMSKAQRAETEPPRAAPQQSAAREPQAFAKEEQQRPTYRTDLATTPVASLDELMHRFRVEVPSFLAAMVIEGKTSMPVVTLSDLPELELDIVSAFYRDLVRSAESALTAIGKTGPQRYPLEEILITSQDDFVLLRALRNGSHCLYMLMDRDSNPGMARVVVRRYLEQLEAFLA